MIVRPVLGVFVSSVFAAAAAADEPPRWAVDSNLRLRQERVRDDALGSEADATTLRLRTGLLFSTSGGFSARIEGEAIGAAGAHDDGTSPASGRPTIIDPAGVELNQAWLSWAGDATRFTLGRQRLLFDNQRWIGNSGWRQNEQTFDATALQWQPRPEWLARHAWIRRVHRVNSDDAFDPLARERDLDTHLFNLAWTHDSRQLAGYAYLHEDRDVAAASTATAGLRWSGSRLHDDVGWGWTLELAQQRDYASNPLSFEHDYWLVEPTFSWGGLTWRAGWEHLGGDGNHALQAPLGTLHAFNGWADKFLVTPSSGLEDRWLGTGGKLGRGTPAGPFTWNVAWHDYRADVGGRYGTEWDASLGFPLRDDLTALVKFADYRSEGFARDAIKWWLQLEWVH